MADDSSRSSSDGGSSAFSLTEEDKEIAQQVLAESFDLRWEAEKIKREQQRQQLPSYSSCPRATLLNATSGGSIGMMGGGRRVVESKVDGDAGGQFAAMAAARVSKAERLKSLVPNLDAHQVRCALCPFDRPLLIRAGAGSGKTRTLVARAVHMLLEGVPPSKIVLLTFTRKSAEELKGRIRVALLSTGAASSSGCSGGGGPSLAAAAAQITATTLHSFSLNLLRQYSDEHRQKEVIGDTERRELCNDVVSTLYPEKSAKERASVVRTLGFQIDKRKGLVPNDPREEAKMYKSDMNRMFEEYERQKNALHAIDFGDMQREAFLLLTRIEPGQSVPTRDIVRRRYSYFLVDEFQDFSELQVSTLYFLVGRGGQCTCVGDSNQSIYEWRGALRDVFLKFKQKNFDRPVAEERLMINYRSTDKLVCATGTIVHEADYLAARSEAGKGVTFKRLPTDIQMLDECSDLVSELANRTRIGTEAGAGGAATTPAAQFRSVAVLCRTRKRVKQVHEYLKGKGIPCQALSRVSPTKLDTFKSLIAHIRLIVNEHSTADVLRDALCTTVTAHKPYIKHLLMEQKRLQDQFKTTGSSSSAAINPQAPAYSPFSTLVFGVNNDFRYEGNIATVPPGGKKAHQLNSFVDRIRQNQRFLADASLDVAGTVKKVVFGLARAIMPSMFEKQDRERKRPRDSDDHGNGGAGGGGGGGTAVAFDIVGNPLPAIIAGDDNTTPALTRQGNSPRGDDDEDEGMDEDSLHSALVNILDRKLSAFGGGGDSAGVAKEKVVAVLQQLCDEFFNFMGSDDFGGKHDPTANAVTVTTVHQAKGLEWRSVVVFGCVCGHFPLIDFQTNEPLSEEERRIFYVASSRAMDELHFLSACNDSGGRTVSVTPYLDLLPEEVLTEPSYAAISAAVQETKEQRDSLSTFF